MSAKITAATVLAAIDAIPESPDNYRQLREARREALAFVARSLESGVIVEWAAAHAENGAVYNVYRTQGEAQAFVDSMAEVGHPMFTKRREHTPATRTPWEAAK